MQIRIVGKPVNDTIRCSIEQKMEKEGYRLGWATRKQKVREFEKADLVVLPYRWGPYQSAVMMDAIAYGCPLVVTKVGSLHELVEEEGIGEIIRPRDPHALAKAINHIDAHFDAYKKKIMTLQKKMGWPKIAKKHAELYREVIKQEKLVKSGNVALIASAMLKYL